MGGRAGPLSDNSSPSGRGECRRREKEKEGETIDFNHSCGWELLASQVPRARERGKKQKRGKDRNCVVVERRNRKADNLRGPLVTPLNWTQVQSTRRRRSGVCPAIPVTPATDPGGQHDLPLSSGHPSALACEYPPQLSRPGLHLTAGGGRRGFPAEVPASLTREQPPPLGQYTEEWLCLFVESVLIFWESTGTSSLVKHSGRCRPPNEWPFLWLPLFGVKGLGGFDRFKDGKWCGKCLEQEKE